MARTGKVNVNPNDVDATFHLDCSGSMGWGADRGNTGPTRWLKGEELMTQVAIDVAEFDDDGLTVYVFNDRYSVVDGVTPETVAGLFRKHTPSNGTTLAPTINHMLNSLLPAKKKAGFMARGYEKVTPVKPIWNLVFTDGCPSDKQAVADAIVDATRRTERGNIGFIFVQVGYDSEATSFLEWLDTNLRGAEYDCVAITRLESIAGLKTEDLVLRAFNGGN